MYETIRIVKKVKPKYVIWENVPNVLSAKHRHNFDKYLEQMEELGYTNYYDKLNAKDYGIPQNRLRVFTISILGEHTDFAFPPKQELKLRLKDMLEDNVDEKYYLKDYKIQNIVKSEFIAKKNIVQKEICATILSRDYKDPKCVYVLNKYKEFIEEKGYIPNMFNPYNKTEIKDIAPTQSTCCGSSTSSATILVKENTKKGYAEAKEGDSINIAYLNSNTRRGRVGKQVAQTTTCNNSMATVKDMRIRKLSPLECWRLMRV